MNLKTLALIIVTVVFVYKMLLRIIEWRSADNPIPANVADVYDAETYKKWRSYHAEKSRLGMMITTTSFVVDVLLLAFNVYAAFAGLFPKGVFVQMLAVLVLSDVVSVFAVPFAYYETMVIEEKYGFNRSTKKTFWMDQLKGAIIGFLMTLVMASLLLWVHRAFGQWLALVFAAGMTILVLAIAFLYPVLSRVFNKFTPLEEGELRENLTHLLEKHGYKVRAIQVMDASKRSTKSNAYFAGFGKMKTIVLYDTLVEAMTPDEICAVFAHEMGHGLHKDTLKNQILSFVQMLVLGVLAALTLQSVSVFAPFGFSAVNYGFALLLIVGVEFSLIAPLFGLLINAHSRRAEYRADAQAVEEGYGEALVSALKKLAKENFSELAPDPLLVKLEYSHPPLSLRIAAIEEKNRK